MRRINRLKRILAADAVAYGGFHGLGSPAVAEIMGQAGCDFVLIDGEHGLGDRETLLHCLQALASTSATSVFRVASHDAVGLKRALDMGVEAVMIPNVATAEEARAVVAACRYPPRGIRGFAAPFVRASDYGRQTGAYLADCEQELVIIVMIESDRGVANARAIAEVEGVDIVQLGTLDLAYDMGLATSLDHPELRAAIATAEAGVRAGGKRLGGVLAGTETSEEMSRRGYRLLTVGFDTQMLVRGFAASLASARQPSGT